MKEYKGLLKAPVENCTLIVDEKEIYNWTCNMQGPPDSPYAGGTFKIKITFPSEYPFKAPSLIFETKIFHPSVETESGKICADILSEGWGPTLNAKHCIQTLYGMLQAPDPNHPLQDDVATMLRDDPKEFGKQAKKFTKQYAA